MRAPGLRDSFLLPLDTIAGAVFAIGSRRLSRKYTGACYNLRRSSDNAQKDFGFVGNDLDIGGISSWGGSDTLFVTKAYDQSGNGNDVSQATAANQPTLTLNKTPNGKSAIVFSLSAHTSLVSGGTTVHVQPFALFAGVERTGSFTSAQRIVSDATINGLDFNSTADTVLLFAGSNATFGSILDSQWHALSALFDGASSTVTADGSAAETGNPGTGSFTEPVTLGGGTVGLDGNLATAIIYARALTTSEQRALISAERTWGGW